MAAKAEVAAKTDVETVEVLHAEPRACALRGSKGHFLRGWSRGVGNCDALFLHGVGDHSRVFDPVLERLPAGLRGLAVDLRGHGDSAWSDARDYSRSAFRRDLDQIVADLPGERFVLVGHSLGGALALELAAARPERLAGLCLLDVGPAVEPAALQRLETGLAGNAREYADLDDYTASLGERYWLADARALGRFARHSVRPAASGGLVPKLDPATRSVLHERSDGQPGWAQLRRVACPVLVVRAVGSAVLSRAVAQRMVESLPNGRLCEIPRAGHALLLDNPQAVTGVVVDFLRSALADRTRRAAAG